jgi:hypothetical protein
MRSPPGHEETDRGAGTVLWRGDQGGGGPAGRPASAAPGGARREHRGRSAGGRGGSSRLRPQPPGVHPTGMEAGPRPARLAIAPVSHSGPRTPIIGPMRLPYSAILRHTPHRRHTSRSGEYAHTPPYSAILPTCATRHEVGSMDIARLSSGPSGGSPSVSQGGPPPPPRPLRRGPRRLEPPPTSATRGPPDRQGGRAPSSPPGHRARLALPREFRASLSWRGT